MKFYTIENLVDGGKISSSGVDVTRMSKAFEIIDKKSELKTLDKIMDLPFIFLNGITKFTDISDCAFVEQGKKLSFALVKENTIFKIMTGQNEYSCAVYEGQLVTYKDENKLKQLLTQKSITTTDPVEAKALDWLNNGRVGLSSATMCATLFPNLKEHHRFEGMFDDDDKFEINWPHDNDDFNRCQKFLEAVPEAKTRLNELKTLCPEWENLVNKWNEITTLNQEGKGKEVYEVISQCVRLRKPKNSM
jgi:hypothetical protein